MAYASPWFVDWRIVLLIFILYRLQFIVFGNCVLSKAEFGETYTTFWHYYVKKIWPNVNKKKLDLITDWVLPILIVLIAYIIQN